MNRVERIIDLRVCEAKAEGLTMRDKALNKLNARHKPKTDDYLSNAKIIGIFTKKTSAYYQKHIPWTKNRSR